MLRRFCCLQVMMNALEKAPVSVILLDKHFLEKECPVGELRRIMERADSGDEAGSPHAGASFRSGARHSR